MKATSILLLGLMLAGCATTSKDLARLSIGMTKPQVLQVLGPPHAASAQGDAEILVYNLDVENLGGKREYFIKLVEGKVESYGQKGDFDSAAGLKRREEITIKNR